jgi:hypothetical protein
MIKNFTFIALTCFLIAFTSSCTKDSVGSSNSGGTSSFTFDGAPGSCATPAVAGIYSIDRPMDASNTLTFTVNVTVKGTYSVRTTTSNGVYFEAGGTFTTTGPQTIVFLGKGIPVKAGDFPYVPATNNTCNFTVSFLSGAPVAVFTYAGGTGSCTAPGINGVYAAGVQMGSGNYVDLAVTVTTPGAYTVSTNGNNGISFSGSGAFTANGPQTIRLIGNGTPTAQGPSFSFNPSGGCSFSITVAPPPPPAAFTYTCAAPTFSGTFAAGTALTSSSTITLGVNVSTAGLYSVTTNSSNGVTFSASGVFPGMGPQTITLRSTNTPTAAGPFSYTPSGAGCSFDVTYTSGPPPAADFLRCTIDGAAKDFTSNLGGIFQPGLFSVDGDMGTTGFTVSVIDNNGDPITVGTYNKATLSNLTRYASASYLPDVSNPLGGWQPFPLNSNPFTVTISTITTSPNKITGTFSGDLFDISGGNKKQVSGGTFSISY